MSDAWTNPGTEHGARRPPEGATVAAMASPQGDVGLGSTPMSATPHRWTALGVPVLVFLMLVIQLVQAFRGFHLPHPGLLGFLEAPGTLLGLGGVLVLLVLLAWLLLGWSGRDPSTRPGPAGLLLPLFGTVVLGLALAGISGLLGGEALGGRWGEGLGAFLQASVLGKAGGLVLLLLMAAPAGVLAFTPIVQAAGVGTPRAPTGVEGLRPPPGIFEGSAGRDPGGGYPERRFDEDGNEIPMIFDARDVGEIRLQEAEDEDTGTALLDPEDEDEEGAEDGPELDAAIDTEDDEVLPPGVRWTEEEDEREAGEAAPDDAGEEEDIAADPAGIPDALPPGVRYADDVDEADGEEAADDDEDDEAPLPSGIRYADEDAGDDEPSEEDLEEEDETALSAGIRYADEATVDPETDVDDEDAAEAEWDEQVDEAGLDEDEAWTDAVDEDAEEEGQDEDADADAWTGVAEEAGDDEPDEGAADEDEAEDEAPAVAIEDEEWEDEDEVAQDADEYAAIVEAEGDVGAEEDEDEAPTSEAAEDAEPDAAEAGDGAPEDEAEREAEAKARYRAKLSGAGFFDEAPAPPFASEGIDEVEEAPEAGGRGTAVTRQPTARSRPVKKASRPTKAAKSAKKSGTRKKAAATKKPTARKPATAKKEPAKKATTRKAPVKKATGKKAPAKAPSPAPAAKKAPAPKPARKGTGTAVDDELLARAVEVAFERGAASSVLLSRKLGVGYARARTLMDALVKAGVLGEMTSSGARPVLISREEWDARG